MATWIVGIVLAVLLALVARYVFHMFKAGKCAGCSVRTGGGACHCHAGGPSKSGEK